MFWTFFTNWIFALQLVDESVEITAGMRAFLCAFLSMPEAKLPAKICLECYQRGTDCRNFKERCDKGINKLSKSAVYSGLILGGSKEEIKAAQNRYYTIKNSFISQDRYEHL